MNRAKRTVFSDPEKPDQDKFYGQIAWFQGEGKTRALSLIYKQGGYFDFIGKVLKAHNLSLEDLTWHISDPLPFMGRVPAAEGTKETSPKPDQTSRRKSTPTRKNRYSWLVPAHWTGNLLNCDALCQVARLVNIQTAQSGDMVCHHL